MSHLHIQSGIMACRQRPGCLSQQPGDPALMFSLMLLHDDMRNDTVADEEVTRIVLVEL